MGNESDTGGAVAGLADAGLTAPVRAAYDAEPSAWAAGPEGAYAVLATSLLADAAVLAGIGPVSGKRVLDLGAGTGVAGRAALAAGALQVVSVDLAASLLRRCGPRQHPVAADAAVLPFRDRSFDLVVAAFSLNHFRSVEAGLTEARRVASALVASTFAPGWAHPAKAAIDATLAQFGYRPPAWYLTMKNEAEPRLADARLFRASASAAGFGSVESRTVSVATGLASPAELAGWRLGMAHIASFVSSLDPDRQAGLRRAAEAAVQDCEPLVVRMLVHAAR